MRYHTHLWSRTPAHRASFLSRRHTLGRVTQGGDKAWPPPQWVGTLLRGQRHVLSSKSRHPESGFTEASAVAARPRAGEAWEPAAN